MTSDIEAFLADVDILAELSPEHLHEIAKGARERTYDPNDSVLEMDQPALAFHAIRSGMIAVEINPADRGPLIIETLGPGEVVGVSWLLPPYRWAFAARAIEPTTTVMVDAEPIRDLADQDPAFGYQLYKRFSSIIHHRLVSARIRALDLYGRSTT